MKILLVEDDGLYRDLATKALSTAGHAVTVVSDGSHAIGKIQNNTFDLMITDIFMPIKEGLELIQEVRLVNSTIKIIAISSGGAVGHSSFLKMSEAFGANETLRKPFTPEQLIEKVDQVAAQEIAIKMKILIVDDDGLYRDLATKALSKAGHSVATAVNGAEAISKAERDAFDLIITDIFMPNKDGMDVIQKVRKMQPTVGIIAISSNESAEFTSFKVAETLGSNGCLQKPFTPEQLIQKVNEVARSEAKKRQAKK